MFEGIGGAGDPLKKGVDFGNPPFTEESWEVCRQ
jgi:hypothetical protein